MNPPMSTEYQKPILTSLLNFLGVVIILGTVTMSALKMASNAWGDAFSIIIGGILAGLIYLGVGQAVDYLARTAHATTQLTTLLQSSIAPRLENIEGRLSPSNPVVVRIDTLPFPPSATTAYYYYTNGSKHGPVPASQVRQLWGDGMIQDESPLLREGDTEWRTYRELLSVKRKALE
jgi:hypothetical protein